MMIDKLAGACPAVLEVAMQRVAWLRRISAQDRGCAPRRISRSPAAASGQTCMELTAARVPFLYFPLHNHFEQVIHVRHRLRRYGAGTCVEYDQTDPDRLAAAIAHEIDRPVTYHPVATDGAQRAAALLAGLL